jgi:hypothetical protein
MHGYYCLNFSQDDGFRFAESVAKNAIRLQNSKHVGPFWDFWFTRLREVTK